MLQFSSHYMLEQTESKNGRGPDQCQSLKISPDIFSLYLYKLVSGPLQHALQKPRAYIWRETPNDISVPLHYDSYEYIRSSLHLTPQAAGNTTPRDLIIYGRPHSALRKTGCYLLRSPDGFQRAEVTGNREPIGHI